ncbi:hypothetical protein C0989_000365 [Termitomyces sp. Mn162]|nr:hypothetical protein C0989_000365 [Termitomyces sp. Mn162]
MELYYFLQELQFIYTAKLLSAFLLQGSATALVILVEGLSMGECQGQKIQEVQVSKGERLSVTHADGHMLSNSSLAFFLGLGGTDRALPRAPAHCYLALGSVYFRAVLTEPYKAEDHVLSAQAGDGKDCMLHMVLIVEDKVNYGADGACFMRCSINVENWNGLVEWLHG